MGFISGRSARRSARERRVRDAAYAKAIRKGKTDEQAARAAERAPRRRKAAVLGAVLGGG